MRVARTVAVRHSHREEARRSHLHQEELHSHLHQEELQSRRRREVLPEVHHNHRRRGANRPEGRNHQEEALRRQGEVQGSNFPFVFSFFLRLAFVRALRAYPLAIAEQEYPDRSRNLPS